MDTNLTPTLSGRQAALQGWGRSHRSECFAVRARTDDLLQRAVTTAASGGLPRPIIARGGGNSYGDAGTISGGTVLDMRGRNRLLHFDTGTGMLTAEAGFTLGQVLDVALPHGWLPPVLPGSRHVTLGGAVAADVHGKNHPGAGSMGRHVTSVDVLCPTDERPRRLGPRQQPEEFWATVGGLGLTGAITSVAVQLRRVEPKATTHRARARNLEEVMEVMDRDHHGGDELTDTHSVAWLDSTAPSARTGRGLVHTTLVRLLPASAPDHDAADVGAPGGAGRANAHPWAPEQSPGRVRCITRPTIAVANRARWLAPTGRRRQQSDLPSSLLPLRHGDAWPALFGPKGLVQYQFCVPSDRGDVLADVLALLRARRMPPALTSLKRLGAADPAPLTFAHPGWTMAMDLPAGWNGLAGALDDLDDLVAAAGGRVYLAKDSRLTAGALTRMYPELPAWRGVQASMDPTGILGSDLSGRVGLTETVTMP